MAVQTVLMASSRLSMSSFPALHSAILGMHGKTAELCPEIGMGPRKSNLLECAG